MRVGNSGETEIAANVCGDIPCVLAREEYVEQAYLFKTLRERMHDEATQELLMTLRHEILATTQLPVAMEFMAAELRRVGCMSTAMRYLAHYFTPFQTYIMMEAERAEGRFDFRIGLEILEKEAGFRADNLSPPGLFLFQFEALSRNRLNYDLGLKAMSEDPVYSLAWREWIKMVRHQLGLVDIAELIYVRSAYYPMVRKKLAEKEILFGEKEGRIALANRRKDPFYLFSAFQRHLNYPSVPRPMSGEPEEHVLIRLERKIDRLEAQLKLLEEESRGGINITRFYKKPEHE